VQVWPSVASVDPEAGGEGTASGHGIVNIAMTSPFGHAQFEAPASAIAGFLRRTYQIVPEGEETNYIDFDAEITELLGQA
jgi:Streptomyces sporulation and cell division protein, SsgA